MEVRFEYGDYKEETQLRAIRSMADPLDLCEVSWRTRTKDLIRDAGPKFITRDDGVVSIFRVGPWVEKFSVPVRGMEALRHLVLTTMKSASTDDLDEVSMVLLMGGKEIHRHTLPRLHGEGDGEYPGYVTPQSVLDTADSMLIFMCRNGARVP